MIGKSLVGAGTGNFRNPSWAALLMIDCRRSTVNTNNKRERGSPCLTPLLQWKVLPGTLLRRTADVPELRMELLQSIHFCPKPLYFMTSSIVLCSILSKAFSKSNLSITISLNGGRGENIQRTRQCNLE